MSAASVKHSVIDQVLDELVKKQVAVGADDAMKLCAKNDHFRQFILLNLVRMLECGGFGEERNLVQVIRQKIYTDSEFSLRMFNPYLCAVAIGYRLAEEERKVSVVA